MGPAHTEMMAVAQALREGAASQAHCRKAASRDDDQGHNRVALEVHSSPLGGCVESQSGILSAARGRGDAGREEAQGL